MSAVHTIPPTSTGPIRQGLGLPDAFNPPAPLPPDWPVPAEAPPPSDQSPSSSPSSLVAHTSSLPPLTPDQDRLFEALAKGQTSPSELSTTLNLPVRQVLDLLATPEITFHLQVLENAIDYLARHTTRLRHNLAFKSLEKALDSAAAKDNPAEIRRIATLLLKPAPPLPDAENAHSLSLTGARVGARVPASSSLQPRATDRLSSSGRCSVQASSNTHAAHASPQPPDARSADKPGLVPPAVPAQPAMLAAPASTQRSSLIAQHSHSPAQPRAA